MSDKKRVDVLEKIPSGIEGFDDITGGDRTTVAEWFYSDADGSMGFEQYEESVPPPVLAWFESEATRRLPPRSDAV